MIIIIIITIIILICVRKQKSNPLKMCNLIYNIFYVLATTQRITKKRNTYNDNKNGKQSKDEK